MRKTNQKKLTSNNSARTRIDSLLDVWLYRCGNLSQILLGIFTIAGFFFIVVPIYQKELLSESIAKSELRLSELNMEIENLKTAERFRNVRINLLVLHDRCSKLFQNLLYKSPLDNTPRAYEIHSRSVLEFNAEECWVDSYKEIMKDVVLTDSELQRLDDDINGAAREIKKERQKFLVEYDSYLLPENESSLVESKPYDVQENILIKMGATKDDILKSRREFALREAKLRINEKYNSFLRSQALSLRGTWGSIEN